jgi:hypothetical protein
MQATAEQVRLSALVSAIEETDQAAGSRAQDVVKPGDASRGVGLMFKCILVSLERTANAEYAVPVLATSAVSRTL